LVDFLLNRKTEFYFWTGLLTGIAVIGNFGIGYSSSEYADLLFPIIAFVLLLITGTLAFSYFRSQNRADSKLESGCFGGITTIIVIFNFGYSLLLGFALL
jgi:hypothetical protein